VDKQALEALAHDRRLQRIQAGPGTARSTWESGQKALQTARVLLDEVKPTSRDPARSFEAAYDAIFKATVAILRCLGYRIAGGEQRVTAVMALRAMLGGDEKPRQLADDFDAMRRRRNFIEYEGGSATETQARAAIATADAALKLLDPIYQEWVRRALRGDRGPRRGRRGP